MSRQRRQEGVAAERIPPETSFGDSIQPPPSAPVASFRAVADRSPNIALRVRAARRLELAWPLLRQLYRFRRLRNRIRSLCRRFEGGGFHSTTLRRILDECHGIKVGRYSYGSVLDPFVLPEGSLVGAYCSVGQGLIVVRRDHPIDRPALHPFFYDASLGAVARDMIPYDIDNPLEVGNDVWIGDRVTILAGCRRIGNGAIVAAGAIVTRDVAPYTLVAGVPARLIRSRFAPSRIAAIEATRWWERDICDLLDSPPLPDLFGTAPDFANT